MAKKQVFFFENSETSKRWTTPFREAAIARALRPVFWSGAGHQIRNSNQDGAITDDLYGSDAAVICLGPARSSGDNEDHWIIPELQHLEPQGIKTLVICLPSFPTNLLAEKGYVGQFRVVADESEFVTALNEFFEQLDSI